MGQVRVTESQLKEFYINLFKRCDAVDKADDEFEAMGEMSEIENLAQGCADTVPWGMRQKVLREVMLSIDR
jgi:hypothetical protein